MGEVWRAEQREPVQRRVPVKLVKAGMNTPEGDRAVPPPPLLRRR
jgi:hypothetical protein